MKKELSTDEKYGILLEQIGDSFDPAEGEIKVLCPTIGVRIEGFTQHQQLHVLRHTVNLGLLCVQEEGEMRVVPMGGTIIDVVVDKDKTWEAVEGGNHQDLARTLLGKSHEQIMEFADGMTVEGVIDNWLTAKQKELEDTI